MICQEVITNVRRLLRDVDNTLPQRTDSALLDWLSEGYTALVTLKPSANIEHRELTLVGGIDQMLPGDAVSMIRPLSNVGGRTITAVDPDSLYAYLPSWPSLPAVQEIEHVLLDEHEPRQFQTYPPAQADIKIKAALAIVPPAVTDVNDDFGLRDEYAPAITDYICYRALSEDADNPNNFQRSQGFYATFAQQLGVKVQHQMAVRPVRSERA